MILSFEELVVNLLVLSSTKHIVNFKDHAAKLGCKHELLLLSDQRLEHTLSFHVYKVLWKVYTLITAKSSGLTSKNLYSTQKHMRTLHVLLWYLYKHARTVRAAAHSVHAQEAIAS